VQIVTRKHLEEAAAAPKDAADEPKTWQQIVKPSLCTDFELRDEE
jgi:hypothetical protein